MKLIIILLVIIIPNFSFAQKNNNNYSIKIEASAPLIGQGHWFNIVKTEDSVRIIYSVLDSIRFQLLIKDPEYIKLQDSINKVHNNPDYRIIEKVSLAKYKLTEKYYVYDSDTVCISLNDYPDYSKLLDSIYTGTNFNDTKGRTVLDGVYFSVNVISATVNREFHADNPDESSNPTIFHLTNDTFNIYVRLRKRILIHHRTR
ncbi:hypothetical protein [Mucilaginibacter sp.]